MAIITVSGPWVGQWLVVNQHPRHVRAIVVLGGGPINRLARAAQLFHEGYAPDLILSGGSPAFGNITQAQAMDWQAVNQFSVPPSALILDNHSRTTYQNAMNTHAIMKAHHWQSAMIVSSDYHMRRVRFLFSRIFQSTGIHLTFVAASDPFFRPSRWWANPKSAATTLGEYAKLLANAVQMLFRGH